MNATLGIFGVIGVLAYECSYWLSKMRSDRNTYALKMLLEWRYYVVLFCFLCIVFVVTCVVSLQDMNVQVFPIHFANVNFMEVFRALLIGLASVHIYKTPVKSSLVRNRVETTSGQIQPLTISAINRWWRSS